ncbi:hypothetical protein IFM89_015002 [Coptis chinensis]|uniref:Replication protein A 70 kDa DNA-binding subunit B/D first OB fold domain-containing protein n=1 Tax=Coptis chinensis TaxID=261450 RepID=A0A835HMK2_9MAGN|nr:hypothetical protein IFM89_015002 [Coptis chinensis]
MEKVQMDMEETRYHPLSDISVGMDSCKIKVRLSRKWNVADQNIPLDKQIGNMRIDMILIDETGVQVHATVLKRHAQSLSPLLQEGQVLHIENFSVTSVLNDYRPVRNKCRLFFNWDTIVKTINGIHSEIPMYDFDFLEFGDLATRFGDIRNCSDAYGRLTKISEIMETTGGTLREIYLDNGRGSEAKVTLWGNTVNLIDKDVIETATSGPVLVVTSLIIREFFDEYHFSSTNSTQLLFNLEIPEVRSIMNSFDDGKVELLIGSSSTQSNVEERSVRNRKTLSEIAAETTKVPNGSQVVKDILNKLIGCSFVFELKVNEYSFRGEVRQSLTTTRVFPDQFETESSLSVVCSLSSEANGRQSYLGELKVIEPRYQITHHSKEYRKDFCPMELLPPLLPLVPLLMAPVVLLDLSSAVRLAPFGFSCNWRANSRFHNTSPIDGRSFP